MFNFFKGIVVGLGAVAPGLSGSVLLVIFGLYKKTIDAIGTIFKNFKKTAIFLLPIFLGIGVGAILFSKGINFLLNNFEAQTRYAFLGLIIGTIPLFYKEVKKEGWKNKYYIIMISAFIIGLFIFQFNKNLFPVITKPNLMQSVLLGIAIAGSSIIPGVDSAAILSSLGLYELYVSSLANLNMHILIPACVGLAVGVLVISFLMSKLIKKFYTVTFSIIFGLFLSIIPNVLNSSCRLEFGVSVIFPIILTVLGFCASYYLGDIKNNNQKINKCLNRSKK